jgi:hypothetical protein
MEGLLSFHKLTTVLIHSAAEQMLASIRNALSKINPFRFKSSLAQSIHQPISQHVPIHNIIQQGHPFKGNSPNRPQSQIIAEVKGLPNSYTNPSSFPVKLSSFINSYYHQQIRTGDQYLLNSSKFYHSSKKNHSSIQNKIVDLCRDNKEKEVI